MYTVMTQIMYWFVAKDPTTFRSLKLVERKLVHFYLKEPISMAFRECDNTLVIGCHERYKLLVHSLVTGYTYYFLEEETAD